MKRQILAVVASIVLFPLGGEAFLGEELGLDMYETIDKGVKNLETVQYEYEMQGQSAQGIQALLNPFLADIGIECDIGSLSDIEVALGNTDESQIAFIYDACNQDGEPLPNVLFEEVTNTLAYVKSVNIDRAQAKTELSYNLSQMGIYTDGSLENSSFDLMYDLTEIDRVLLSDEIGFESFDTSNSSNTALEEFLTKNLAEKPIEAVSNLIGDNQNSSSEKNTEDIEINENSEEETTFPIETSDDEHQYACLPGEENHGFGSGTLARVLSQFGINSGNSASIEDTENNSGDLDNSGVVSAEQNTSRPAPSGNYSAVNDEFGCEGVFCIDVEMVTSDYGLKGGNLLSLQSIFTKVAEHLEKPANVSLTQSKMTTNNFEISSIISNLPDLLRGGVIQIQFQPVPVVELIDDSENPESPYVIKNMLFEYYKNLGLEYNRANDLEIFSGALYETKVFQTSGDMPITFPESRLNELAVFEQALAENNRIFTEEIQNKLRQDMLTDFDVHFSELERFTSGLEDFATSISSIIDNMKQIPSRSS